MKIIILFFIFGFLIFNASARDFNVNPLNENIELTYSYPKGDKGWSDPYIQDFDIEVLNNLNVTLPVSISTSSNYNSYVRLTPSESSISIPRLERKKIKITVKVVDSAGENTYSENIRFASGYDTQNVRVSIKTNYPSPTLSLLENYDLGELSAGKTYTKTITIKEVLKFNAARNVNLRLNEAGPIYNINVDPSSFSYIDTKGSDVTFSFIIKDKGLAPGTYRPHFSISSTNNAELLNDYFEYSIPNPIAEISKSETELFFEYGKKEQKNQQIMITENGGKTPLENTIISFEKLSREFEGQKKEYQNANWFNFPKNIDYIIQGTSKSIDIMISKPEEALTGKYIWEGKIKTQYSGDKSLIFNFIVQPPDVNSLINNLTEFESTPLVRNYQEADTFIKTSKSLLIKDVSVMSDISNVISLTNVVITYFNSINNAYEYIQQGDNLYNEAYEEFSKSNEEIKKFDTILLKTEYSSQSNDIKNSAQNIMRYIAMKLINGLEQNVNKLMDSSYSDASYLKALEANEKIRNIYSWLNENDRVQLHENKINEIKNKIVELEKKANDMENKNKNIHDEIILNTWGLFGENFVKNPFKFQYFLNNYVKIITNFNEISRSYKLTGNNKNFEISQEKLSTIKTEYERFKYINGLYIIILVYILFMTILKSVQGSINFMKDLKDVRLNEIGRSKHIKNQ
ncbi:MAG: hypothetical protein FIB07_12505 [Candidatus Methanoperedens sp.]|nr:hypothetical protein [Candidatus Methanoperedens sp.]